MNDTDTDELFETLSLNRDVITGDGAPYGGYGGSHLLWGHYQWALKKTSIVVWTNHEGKKHRIYGPAVKSIKYGIEEWYKDGILHRIGGPARIHKDNKFWYKEGVLHNLEGPAVVEGAGPKQYWIDGVRFSPKQYKWEISRRKLKGLIK